MTQQLPPGLTARFVKDCIAKLALLERSVPHKPPRLPLDPVVVDVANVDEAARRIAEFVGLGRCRFFISFGGPAESVAGNIELRDDVIVKAGGFEFRTSFSDVCSITLTRTLKSSSGAVQAALAHEITHQFLKVNCVPSDSGLSRGYQDEILTEVASVWLGLGKIVLNGCESRAVNTNWSGTRTTTTQRSLGYLTRSQFSLVYLLVSSKRDLSVVEREDGLSVDAFDGLRGLEQYVPHEYGGSV